MRPSPYILSNDEGNQGASQHRTPAGSLLSLLASLFPSLAPSPTATETEEEMLRPPPLNQRGYCLLQSKQKQCDIFTLTQRKRRPNYLDSLLPFTEPGYSQRRPSLLPLRGDSIMPLLYCGWGKKKMRLLFFFSVCKRSAYHFIKIEKILELQRHATPMVHQGWGVVLQCTLSSLAEDGTEAITHELSYPSCLIKARAGRGRLL